MLARIALLVSGLAYLLMGQTPVSAQDFEARVFKDDKGGSIPYRLLKPEPYDPKKQYPLVLFLHGAGERGTDNQAQLKNAVSVFTLRKNRRKFPCFVIAPQCPSEQRWVEMDWGADSGVQPAEPSPAMRLSREALLALQKEFRIDPARVYAVGISMGGYGVWDALSRYPGFFAAGVAVCGGGDESKAGAIGKTPVWAFHSEDDPIVKVARSRNMIKALREAGGQPIYTEYQKLGHVSWNQAFGEPKLLPWLFSQKKS
jgi:predicted peptidase